MKYLVFSLVALSFVLPLAQETPKQDTRAAQSESHGFVLERDADVPELPFEDNPDPTLCGIPEPWGEAGRAWLTGVYEGELIQPEVLLLRQPPAP